jgi:AbiV family abortive infection protein
VIAGHVEKSLLVRMLVLVARLWGALRARMRPVEVASLTEQTLLEGAWWGIEQAGRDMNSAVNLYNAGDLAGAVVRALLGREEIGRSQKLQTMAAKVSSGGSVTVKNVRGALSEHVRKQRFSVVSVTLKNDPATVAPFKRFIAAEVGEPKRLAARRALDKLARAKEQRLPVERHELRMRAQYVDIDDQGTWVLPCTLDPTIAREALRDAINDYSFVSHNLKASNITYGNAPMAKALAAMTVKPVLVAPVWPSGLLTELS